MNLLKALSLLIEFLRLIKDTDGDGRIDILDSEPENPEVK